VIARYYDPSTAQFLTVDPKVATTLSPYDYVRGNPLNDTDPSGSNDIGCANPNNAEACEAQAKTQGNGCIRAPWGSGWNSNSNGGCQTVLSGSQGAQLGAATVITAVGTVATLGLGVVLFAGIAGDLASGTLLGAVYAGIGAVGMWSILGLPVAITAIGLFWGYSAVAGGSGGCGG
jgi:hypothetical protein